MEAKRIYEGEYKYLDCCYNIVILKMVNKCKEVWVNSDNFLHNENGPAFITEATREYYINGFRSRADGPAVEWEDGTKLYYKDGVPHRLDAPAVELANGEKYWWINGKPISPEKAKILKIWHDRNNPNGI
jgi:hypothetical protein